MAVAKPDVERDAERDVERRSRRATSRAMCPRSLRAGPCAWLPARRCRRHLPPGCPARPHSRCRAESCPEKCPEQAVHERQGDSEARKREGQRPCLAQPPRSDQSHVEQEQAQDAPEPHLEDGRNLCVAVLADGKSDEKTADQQTTEPLKNVSWTMRPAPILPEPARPPRQQQANDDRPAFPSAPGPRSCTAGREPASLRISIPATKVTTLTEP